LSAETSLLPSSFRIGEAEKEVRFARRDLQPVIWFEVEDFLRYFDHFSNPTGVQRLSFEIYRAAKTLFGRSGRVRFCRLSVYSKQLHAIGFDVIRSAFSNPSGRAAPWKTFWEPAIFWEKFPRSIPVIIRHPRFFFSIFKVAVRDVIAAWLGRNRFERLARGGDVIVSLGAGWGIPGYMKHIAEVKRRCGTKFVIFVHDVIPIKHQSFVEPHHAALYRAWLQDAIPVADIVLTNSRYSRAALVELAAQSGWRLPRVEVVEPGSGDRLATGDRTATRFPARYVLFVSTIEIRKNHRLLVRVWQRLLERHGVHRVPSLIFAGQVGWLVDGLLADLEASGYLDGKIVVLRGLSDAELQQAYHSCLFTVFPSLCEGWGLPIAESLAHGKFCVASNRTSLPEVGGHLVDYFDPSNEDDALAKIERPLLDPAYLSAREAQLRAEYRPRTWADCFQALIGALDQTVAADQAALAIRRSGSGRVTVELSCPSPDLIPGHDV
jgi:glycosyltransferase involved in cell wall biosynthesis